jgi:hypothetical protein
MKKRAKTILGLCGLLALTTLVMGDTMVKVNQAAESIAAPQIITVTTTPQTLFTTNGSRTSGRVLFRSIQNTGTQPVLYALNSGGTVTTASYHGVIAGGSGTRDGLGSIVDLSRIPYPVTVATESGTTTIAIIELTQ